MVNALLNSPLWKYSAIHRFGIDIFETHTALSHGFKIKQARLGVKNHDSKDPSSQLASMFRQVITTMFTCLEQYETVWPKIKGVSELETAGEGEYISVPDPIQVDFQGTVNTFTNNFDNYVEIYKTVLRNELLTKFEQLKNNFHNIDLPSDIWAKTVYSFIAKFHNAPLSERDLLVDALRILWIGRVAVFMKETWNLDRNAAERKIIEEAHMFEKLKPYFTCLYFDSKATK